ncbi:DNA glycosylase AlkZ-like family protein [Patulibacter sp.]|uniref:DNA glycosylase AlkZ-like family protein n=1 Tax=Patulibacter sp. TaxID=1912859 RepID=UPI00271F836B|nr:crosslink repair DNA glycosylase YcaQ family protein [Patulibacter sp.]MDO9407339.1 crosslink repair DNA glycosylase YcaQ family protein [Patulibacter sp.]
MSDVRVTDAQALAFRIAGHHLHEHTDPLTAVAACGLQEYPPGHAAVALHARAGEVQDDHPVWDALVTVNAMRGAPYVVPRADVAVFTTALVPEEDDELRALVGSAVAKEVQAAGYGVGEALDLVASAAREGLADGPLDRDAFHQALRERLPDGLLPWCRGCASHHVRPGLWRALGPLGVTEMPGRAVWAPAAGTTVGTGDPSEARRELVRRFLRAYGPSTHSALASWAQTAPAHARRMFASVEDELVAVRQEGARRWVLAADLDRLLDPPAATGVRLLHGHDPYVAGPDRAALAPDPALRKALFPAVGRPGVVLVDGRLAGLWRARKKGRTLELSVDWSGRTIDLGDAPEALARLRGCDRVVLG